MNICFTSLSIKVYSETFIQNLKGSLKGKVFHCYGAAFPFLSLDGTLQNHNTPPFKDIILNRFGIIRRPLRENYLIKYLKKNRINLIFANYGPSGASLAPLAKELDIPLIVHFHGFDASIYNILDKYEIGYKVMFEVAIFIIVVSEEMKSDLLKLGAPESKLVKITYAPHCRFLELKSDYNGNQLFSVGRFVEKKAPYLTLLAYKFAKEKCPALRLKMAGDGELLPICRDICISMKIKDVEFVGILSPEEVAIEMNNSFCFIQHSKRASNGDKEGTPVAILEAMASGLPIVATRHAGISDVVIDGKTGFLVDEGNIEEMGNRIIELFFDREKVRDFGERGREKIQMEFGQEDYFQRINDLVKLQISHG